MNINNRATSLLACRPEHMGFFTWELATNTLHGDAVLAELFDIAFGDVQDGIAIERIIEKIAPDDRSRIAKAIHQAIVTGRPYEETYEVIRSQEANISVVAMGRCFQYSDGTPSYYAGTVVQLGSHSSSDREADLLRAHCQTAATLAKATGEQLAERYLSSALRSLSSGSSTKKR
jgi:hypothetical protein